MNVLPEQPPVPGLGPESDAWAEAFRRRKRAQIRRGLRLTPAERLRWLEETVAELRELQRVARRLPPG